MFNYDISILKKNIARIMKKRNITQSELASAIGMQQSSISKILSCNDSSCFNVPQLVSIAEYLHESIDSLLGITQTEKPQKEPSLSDLCEKLFELDTIYEFNIGTCETGEYKVLDYGSDLTEPITTECIFFKNDKIANLLKELGEVKALGVPNKQLKWKMMNLWKEDTLEKSKTRKKIWEFRNEEEQGKYLANILLDYFNDPLHDAPIPSDLYKSDNKDVLKKFIKNYAPAFFDSEECYKLDEAFNLYIDGFLSDGFRYIPDEIIEELPFS